LIAEGRVFIDLMLAQSGESPPIPGLAAPRICTRQSRPHDPFRHPRCDFRHIATRPFCADCHADFSHRASRLPDPAAGFRSIQKTDHRAEVIYERLAHQSISTVAERSQFLERTERFRPAPAS
jgi:hypothetical protein